MRKTFPMIALALGLSGAAQADSLPTGAFTSFGLTFGTGDVSFETNGGTRLPSFGDTVPAFNMRHGYDWSMGTNGAIGVEAGFTSSLLGSATRVDCTTGGTDRECFGGINETMTAGARYSFAISDAGALMVRGGAAYGYTSVTRVGTRPGNPRAGNPTSHGTPGAYLGVGYSFEVTEGTRFVADITHYKFETQDHVRPNNPSSFRRNVEAQATTMSFGLEFSY